MEIVTSHPVTGGHTDCIVTVWDSGAIKARHISNTGYVDNTGFGRLRAISL